MLRARRVALGSSLLLSATLVAACDDAPTAIATETEIANAALLSRGLPSRPFLPRDQQPIAVPGNTWALYPAGEGQHLAQTFTPDRGGWLGYFMLPIGCTEGVLLNIKLREGLNGPIIAEVNVADLPTVVDNSFQLIQIWNPASHPLGIRVNAGVTYAIELAAFPATPEQENRTCGMSKGPEEDSYVGGRGYYKDTTNPAATFIPLPDGNPTSDSDLPFITLVR